MNRPRRAVSLGRKAGTCLRRELPARFAGLQFFFQPADIVDQVLNFGQPAPSAQTSPNFWVDPRNSVSYPLVVQVPTYRIGSSQDLETVPVTSGGGDQQGQLLLNLAAFGRNTAPLVASQLNIRPVFDVHADVQGRDLYSASRDIERALAEYRQNAAQGLSIALSGQVETMRESYAGLFTGIALAIVLWMLFLSQTPMSVPALMGTLMCIGLATANSILVVSFANQRMAAGDDVMHAAATAAYTRLRPVLMTAGAMIVGMVPMALGIGEGGEQNAPLGRAVIGGLLFATFATLILVPTVYRMARSSQSRTAVVIGHAWPEVDATGAAARGTGLTRGRASGRTGGPRRAQ